MLAPKLLSALMLTPGSPTCPRSVTTSSSNGCSPSTPRGRSSGRGTSGSLKGSCTRKSSRRSCQSSGRRTRILRGRSSWIPSCASRSLRTPG